MLLVLLLVSGKGLLHACISGVIMTFMCLGVMHLLTCGFNLKSLKRTDRLTFHPERITRIKEKNLITDNI